MILADKDHKFEYDYVKEGEYTGCYNTPIRPAAASLDAAMARAHSLCCKGIGAPEFEILPGHGPGWTSDRFRRIW